MLTKSDLVNDPVARVDDVRALLAPGRTAVRLGTSEVGKSTLVNALLGRERQATRPIRARDDRGRHATVRRELIVLPGGALLIDTPGLRLIAPVEDGGCRSSTRRSSSGSGAREERERLRQPARVR